MLCFLPPIPAIRPEPDPVPPRTARAAEAVILIFVVLNVLFVLTGLLPFLVKMEAHPPRPARSYACSPASHGCKPAPALDPVVEGER
jgi:hypothetical protein